jgi:hypothetical protein
LSITSSTNKSRWDIVIPKDQFLHSSSTRTGTQHDVWWRQKQLFADGLESDPGQDKEELLVSHHVEESRMKASNLG